MEAVPVEGFRQVSMRWTKWWRPLVAGRVWMSPVPFQERSGRYFFAWAVDAVLVLALFLGGTALGMASLNAGHGKDGLTSIRCPDEFFGQSLMIVAGRGSFSPDVDSVPGMSDFVSRRSNTFDIARLPAVVPHAVITAADYHVYLIWAVAALWRLFGVSWLVLEPFLALGLGFCAVFVYGLFRLGMNRLLSIAGTALFISSPAVLSQLGSLRDFSKAPFLLAGILALGWLATRKTPQRFILTATGLMGLVTGVGMGFRQDLTILVPASLAVILVLSRNEVYGTRRRRIVAVLVYLAAFAAVAWPMLLRMEGGAQPYHPLAQGYSMGHLRRCSLDPGVCEPLACSNDGFVYDMVLGYARRAAGDGRLCFQYNTPEAVHFTRDWVLSAAFQFPADTVARIYGSTLNMVSGAGNYLLFFSPLQPPVAWAEAVQRPVAAFLHMAGPALGLLALLAAAAVSIRSGFVLLLITLYFCGYVSLDNEWRHTFHLGVAAFWVAGFVVQCLVASVVRTFTGTAEWGAWMRRAALFALILLPLLAIPWQAARVWQCRSLEGLLKQYAAAPRSLAVTKPKPLGDWTLFQLEGKDSADKASAASEKDNGEDDLKECWGIHRTLYAARFRPREAGRTIMTKYVKEDRGHDYSQLLRVSGTAASGGEVWYFFPAYDCNRLNQFEGVALPSEDADNFLGLYAVGEENLIPLLPCATVQEGQPAGRLCARIHVPSSPLDFQFPEEDRGAWPERSLLADQLGHADDALAYFRACVALNPSCENPERRALLLHRAGHTGQALELLVSLVKDRGDYGSCEILDRFLAKVKPPEERLKTWALVVPQCPNIGQVWFFYGKLLAGSDPDGAIAAFRTAMRLLPSDERVPPALQQSLIARGCREERDGDIPGAIDAYREAIVANPVNDEPYRRLTAALPGDSPVTAMIVWDELRQTDPVNVPVAFRCGVAHAVCKDLAGAREAFDAAFQFGGGNEKTYTAAGDAYMNLGAWSDAVSAYQRALALNPELRPQRFLIATGCLNEEKGEIPAAIDAYVEAILSNPSNGEPCWRLDTAFPKTNPEAVAELWRGIWERVPENAVVDVLYGESLALAKSAAARPMLEAALRLGGNDSNVLAHAGSAYASMEDWRNAACCYGRALCANPGMEWIHPRLDDARRRAVPEKPSSRASVSPG